MYIQVNFKSIISSTDYARLILSEAIAITSNAPQVYKSINAFLHSVDNLAEYREAFFYTIFI